MTEKITAETVSQTFNLAALKKNVEAGFGFIVAVPPRQGAREAYEAWAVTDDRKKSSEYVEVPTALPGLMAEAVLFKDQNLAQQFCDAQAGNEAYGARLSVLTLSISAETETVVAAPLGWNDDKLAAIQALMRK